MSRCSRDRCGSEAVKDRLCTAHLADRDERRRRGRLIPKCAVTGCNQQRNSVSDRCGVHWNALLERQRELEQEQEREQAMEDFKERLRVRIRGAHSIPALQEVLCDMVDYMVSS